MDTKRKITRRGLLKGAAGAGIAGAAGVGPMVGCAEHLPEPFRKDTRPTERVTLQFDLPPGFEDTELALHVGPNTYPLQRHTAESRQAARAQNAFLRALPDDELDAFAADAAFVAGVAQSYTLTYRPVGQDPADNRRALLYAGIHVGRRGVESATSIMGGDFTLRPSRLAAAGLRRSDLDPDRDDPSVFVDWEDSAEALVFHHPELMATDDATAAMVKGIISSLPSMKELVLVMRGLGAAQRLDSEYEGWVNAEWSLDFEGNRLPILGTDGEPLRGPTGEIEYAFDWVPHPKVRAAASKVIRAALLAVRNEPRLAGRSYVVSPGLDAIENGEGLPPPEDDGLLKGPTAPGAGGVSVQFSREGEFRHGQRVMRRSLAGRTLSFRVDNSYFRHLGVWAAFKNEADRVMSLAELGVAKSHAYDTGNAVYLGMIDPPPRIMGVPIVNVETYQNYEVTLPNGASKLAIITGTAAFFQGDDRGEYRGVPVPGEAMTYAFEIGLPVFFMAMGAGSQLFKQTLARLAVGIGPQVVAAATQYGLSKMFDAGADRTSATSIGLTFVNVVTKKLVGSAAGLFAYAMAEAAAEAAAKASIPLVGWVMWAVDAAVTAAEVATTVVDLGLSRRYLETVASFTHPVRVRITPDKDHPGAFPQTATKLLVVARCSEAQVYRDVLPFDPSTNKGVIEHLLPAVPSGGKLTIEVQFLSDTGWIAGQAKRVIDPNVLPSGAAELVAELEIEEALVPLTSTTTYRHLKRLAVDATEPKKRVWKATSIAPDVSKHALDCRPDPGALCSLLAITHSTFAGQIGYAFQSASYGVDACGAHADTRQLYMIQSINDLGLIAGGEPDGNLKTLSCGYTRPVHVVFDPGGDVGGSHFAIVPDADGYTVRKVPLVQGDDTWTRIEAAPIWGRFHSQNLASVRYHEQGYLVAIDMNYDKLEVLQLPTSDTPPGRAPVADLVAGRGTNVGLLSGAVAIACARNGASFLVLEQTNARLSAFDRTGNPVMLFAGQVPVAELVDPPGANVTYLDLAVETAGFIYVLSFEGDGVSMNDYRLDVYEPDGRFLARTRGMAAARLAVDRWRNVFTLNFERLIGPNGRTEPSVSEWVPSTP